MLGNEEATGEHIRFTIAFRHTESTAALQEYTQSKLRHALEKFLQKDTEVHVVLSVEKEEQRAEATLRAYGHDFHASEVSDDLYKSVDLLCDSFSKQIQKQKEKIKNHH